MIIQNDSVWITKYLDTPDIEANIISPKFRVSTDLSDNFLKGVIIWHEDFPGNFPRPERVKVVSRFGAGVDNIDFSFCEKNSISVYHVPDYGVDEVSDTALAFLLARSRGLFEYSNNIFSLPDGTWEKNVLPSIRRTSSLVVGIVGAGRIGSTLALKARALGFNVFIYDPYVNSGHEKILGVARKNSLHELYSSADLISFNVPLTDETKGIIDFETLYASSSRPLSVVNTARGGLSPSVSVICEAIKKNYIYSYDTDVLLSEPPSSDELNLLSDPFIRSRFVVTPHTAFYSQEAFLEMRRKAALNVVAGMSGTSNS